jgi:hypothetical protein
MRDAEPRQRLSAAGVDARVVAWKRHPQRL